MYTLHRINRTFSLLLALWLVFGNIAYAHAETGSSQSFSFSGSKAPEEETPVSINEPLSITESAVPFHHVKWGMSYENVLSAVNGKAMKNKKDIQIYVSIPGIDGPQLAIYHCKKNGLEKVSVLIKGKISTAKKYSDTLEGKAIYDLANSFIGGMDETKRIIINGGNYSTLFRSAAADILAGYDPNGSGIDLSLTFYRPVIFDHQQIVSSKRFYKTTEGDGDLLYFTQTSKIVGFDTSYSKSKKYDRSYNAIASKIRMQGSSKNNTFSVPSYGIVYAYAGTVRPNNVSSITFTINDTIYKFSNIYDSGLSVTQYNEYSNQYTIWLGRNGQLFMDALEKSKGTIKVEVRGSGSFQLYFNLPSGVKTSLLADWAAYQSANGNHPFFTDGLRAITADLTVY